MTNTQLLKKGFVFLSLTIGIFVLMLETLLKEVYIPKEGFIVIFFVSFTLSFIVTMVIFNKKNKKRFTLKFGLSYSLPDKMFNKKSKLECLEVRDTKYNETYYVGRLNIDNKVTYLKGCRSSDKAKKFVVEQKIKEFKKSLENIVKYLENDEYNSRSKK